MCSLGAVSKEVLMVWIRLAWYEVTRLRSAPSGRLMVSEESIPKG